MAYSTTESKRPFRFLGREMGSGHDFSAPKTTLGRDLFWSGPGDDVHLVDVDSRLFAAFPNEGLEPVTDRGKSRKSKTLAISLS
jgi:hypothetical protein